MADRRQGPALVTRFQFWLGITVSVISLVAATLKVGQWTERVDGSVQSLKVAAERLEATTTAIVKDHTQLRIDLNDTRNETRTVLDRFNDHIERLPTTPLMDRGTVR